MATFNSGGVNLAYDDLPPIEGSAGTILLVHGFATSRAENWKRLGWLTAFQRKGYRTIAFDHRGHGESDKPHDPDAYGQETLLRDIVGLMDHLDLEWANLMGYSMGARLSLRMALDHPTRVGNVVLGGVGGRMLSADPPAKPGAMTMAEALTTDDPDSITDRTQKGFRLFAEQQGEDRLALAACSQAHGGGRLTADDLAVIRAPTLVVAGALDNLAGDPRALADAIPGAKSVTLPAVDHFSAIPHALFKAAVFDFLEGWLD
jgi:pimeloyl-ACP methyl ester carboxylesterase